MLNPGWIKIRIRDKHPGSATLLRSAAHLLVLFWQAAALVVLLQCVDAPLRVVPLHLHHHAAELLHTKHTYMGYMLICVEVPQVEVLWTHQ